MNDGARAYALRLLAQRAYSTADLRRKLVSKDFSLEAVDALILRCTESGLLDDKKFAVSYSRAKLVRAGASPRRVKQQLARKGIEGAIAAMAVDEVIADEQIDLAASLEKIARKKLASLSGLEAPVQQRRLFAFLARRGYEIADIHYAFKIVFERQGAG